MLPDAGVLVHGVDCGHVLRQDSFVIIGFWLFVEIFINIFLKKLDWFSAVK